MNRKDKEIPPIIDERDLFLACRNHYLLPRLDALRGFIFDLAEEVSFDR